MNLYLNGKEYKVELQKVLSQKLYNEVTPLLNQLENSQGAQKAYESLLQKRIIGDEYFKGKLNLLNGVNAWEGIKDDFKLQEVIADVILIVRENIFEHITLNDSTIPIVFDLFRICVNKKLIHHPELLDAINEPSTSEFWQEQDLNSILDELKFFRANVLARVKTSI